MSEIKIEVVPDAYGACPRCGAYWGHPDPALDYPNRQKVDNHWRCYNPNCTCAYFDPATRTVVEDELPPDEAQEMAERIRREVEEQLAGKDWYEVAPNTFQPLTPDEARERGLEVKAK